MEHILVPGVSMNSINAQKAIDSNQIILIRLRIVLVKIAPDLEQALIDQHLDLLEWDLVLALDQFYLRKLLNQGLILNLFFLFFDFLGLLNYTVFDRRLRLYLLLVALLLVWVLEYEV